MYLRLLGKLLRYDIRWGILDKWKKIIVYILIIFLFSYIFYRRTELYVLHNESASMPGFIDYIMNIFHGMKKFEPQNGQQFQLPVEWMTFHLYLGFFLGNYASDDLSRCGINRISRVQSRKLWIVSKILSNLLSVLMLYGIVYILNYILVMVLDGDKLNFSLTSTICQRFFEMNVPDIETMTMLIGTVLLPLTTSIALSQFQLLIEMRTKPIIGFLVVISIMVLSAYTMTPYLIGNYSMVQRSSLFLEGGISVRLAVTVNLAIAFMSSAVNVILFNKKDIS